MDKEQIRKLAGDKQFITGIYNYCDRWCERCPLTSRCINFTITNEQFADQEARDIKNEKFWRNLSEMFRVTLDLLKENAEREGIDLDSLDMEEVAEEERLNEEAARNHECCRVAKVYGKMVDNWFDSVEDLFEKNEDELNLKEQFELKNIYSFEESEGFEDAVQVIRWYQYLIYVKLMRAIRGKLEEKTEDLDEYTKDSDGSAKVALISIDRSMAAWGKMRNHFLAREDYILDILKYLEQLRRKVEEVFPAARAFIRPGFDKINLNS